MGEPNFEITDNDESDQIGLTSFYSASYPSIRPDNDEVMWGQLKPGEFQVPNQNIDQKNKLNTFIDSLVSNSKSKALNPNNPVTIKNIIYHHIYCKIFKFFFFSRDND